MRNAAKWIAALAFSGALFSCLAEETKEPAYASKKPLYAKVALNEDGSKVLTVVFDESKGTGKGYDVLYADVELAGRLDKAARVEAPSYICPSGAHFYFPPIELSVPYNDKGAGVSTPCLVSLSYERHTPETGAAGRLLMSSAASTTQDFFVATTVRLRDGSAEREYSFKRSITVSPTLSDARVWGFPRRPGVAITTKPDPQKKGNVGIGLDMAETESQEQKSAGPLLQSSRCGCAATEASFQCKPPINAHVEVKTPEGKVVVHRGDAALDKFTFG